MHKLTTIVPVLVLALIAAFGTGCASTGQSGGNMPVVYLPDGSLAVVMGNQQDRLVGVNFTKVDAPRQGIGEVLVDKGIEFGIDVGANSAAGGDTQQNLTAAAISAGGELAYEFIKDQFRDLDVQQVRGESGNTYNLFENLTASLLAVGQPQAATQIPRPPVAPGSANSGTLTAPSVPYTVQRRTLVTEEVDGKYVFVPNDPDGKPTVTKQEVRPTR